MDIRGEPDEAGVERAGATMRLAKRYIKAGKEDTLGLCLLLHGFFDSVRMPLHR